MWELINANGENRPIPVQMHTERLSSTNWSESCTHFAQFFHQPQVELITRDVVCGLIPTWDHRYKDNMMKFLTFTSGSELCFDNKKSPGKTHYLTWPRGSQNCWTLSVQRRRTKLLTNNKTCSYVSTTEICDVNMNREMFRQTEARVNKWVTGRKDNVFRFTSYTSRMYTK
jgi:hypothetical protein